MRLPVVESITYEMQVPGFDNPIKYTSFNSGQYRVLLEAKEFSDDRGFINTVREILKQCIVDDIDIDQLPMYISDYIFLMIRAKSCGEIVDAEYRCNAVVEDVVCDGKVMVPINLANTYIRFPDGYHQKSVIQINESVGMKMRSPSFDQFRSVSLNEKGIFDITDEYVYSCVECVYSGDEVLLPSKDFTLPEFKEWAKTFPISTIEKITEFFRNQPSISMNIDLTCPKCRNRASIQLNGLNDFFE